MIPPIAVAVSATAVQLVVEVGGGYRTRDTKGFTISIFTDQTEPVFLAPCKKDLTTLTGEPLYPGQVRHVTSESADWQSIANNGLWAIAAVGPVSVRVQRY